MEYTVKNRSKKINRLVFRILPKFIFFKLYAPFLSEKARKKRLLNLHQTSALKIADVLMELEGLFLKFAQQLSTLSTLLPAPYIKAFEKAQDESSPRPFSQIKQRIENELGDELKHIFSFIDEKPLGVASIGQVHKAQLKSGEIVAVKVQHLNIDQIAELDLLLIKKLLKIVQRFIKIPGFNTIFEEVAKMIHEELDYEHEATQIATLSKNLKNDNRILIPKTYSAYSTKKVLVMEFLEGEKITNLNFAEQHKINRDQVAANLADIFSKNIFLDGIFHADPHPGNILINSKGQILLLDFGAIGHLSKDMKEGMITLLQAALLKDENLMIAGFQQMGFINNSPGIHRICKKLIRLLNDFLTQELKIEKLNIHEIKFDEIDLSKAFQLVKEINIKELEEVVTIPKDWVLLNKTIALIIGITGELSPQLNIYEEVRPNLLRMVVQKESLGMILKTTLQQQALRMVSLPRKIELFIEQAENGELAFSVKNRKQEVRLLYSLIQQVLFAILAITGYYFYLETNRNFMLYGSGIAAILFLKALILGVYYKRKLH